MEAILTPLPTQNEGVNDDDLQLHLKVIGPVECKQPVLTIELPDGKLVEKHRKNCECCPVSLLIVR